MCLRAQLGKGQSLELRLGNRCECPQDECFQRMLLANVFDDFHNEVQIMNTDSYREEL
jgi:hypothetical protein